jgi:hypothetical protein
MSSFFTIAAGIVIAFAFGWQLALLLTLMVPLLAGSGYIEFQLHYGRQMRDVHLMEAAGRVRQRCTFIYEYVCVCVDCERVSKQHPNSASVGHRIALSRTLLESNS